MSPEAYDRWRQPGRVLAALDLAPGLRVVDVGAGTGYFTMRLAEAVGPRGRVVATDVDPRALAALADLARRAAARPEPGAAPVEVRRVKPADPGLEPGTYDRILLSQVDHLVPDRVDYLRRLGRALAPRGRLAVVNRLQHRAGLLRDAAAAGLAVDRDVTDLPGQTLVILIRGQPDLVPPDPR
jgi:ubiquinone/menaquinone biosynthesis C-methylase UbiE